MSVSLFARLTAQEKIDIVYMHKLVHLTTKDTFSRQLFPASMLAHITHALHERHIPNVHHSGNDGKYCFAVNILPKDMEQALYEHIESIMASEPVLSKIWTIARVFPITLTFTSPNNDPSGYNNTQGCACVEIHVPEFFGPSLPMGANEFRHFVDALALPYDTDGTITGEYDIDVMRASIDTYEHRDANNDPAILRAIAQIRTIIEYAHERNIHYIDAA